MSHMTDSQTQKSPTVQAERILVAPAAKKMKALLNALVDELLLHDGFGRLELDMKILSRRQKEIIIRSGKEYRFVMDFMNDNARVENLSECKEQHGCPYGVREQEH